MNEGCATTVGFREEGGKVPRDTYNVCRCSQSNIAAVQVLWKEVLGFRKMNMCWTSPNGYVQKMVLKTTESGSESLCYGIGGGRPRGCPFNDGL